MKRGKDNAFAEKSGPPGYVPLTLHQLGIGLTYYDEQRPVQNRGRHDGRRQDGNNRYDGNQALPPDSNGADGADLAEPGPDDGMTQEAALDQMQSNRNGGHQGGNGRRHHNNNNNNSRRSRHGGGPNHGGGHGGGGRRGNSHGNGPMRGMPSGGRNRRDDESADAPIRAQEGPRQAAEPRSVESRGAEPRGADSRGADSRNGEWSNGESEE